jgi:hypothetical protein
MSRPARALCLGVIRETGARGAMMVVGEHRHFLSIITDHKPPHGIPIAATDAIFAAAC